MFSTYWKANTFTKNVRTHSTPYNLSKSSIKLSQTYQENWTINDDGKMKWQLDEDANNYTG